MTENQNGKAMNNKFDELAKGLARSVTRRGALKRFSVGLAEIALAAIGLPNEAQAKKPRFHCHCGSVNYGCDPNSGSFFDCVTWCGGSTDKGACGGGGA
jgi:hypothetical protein